MKYLIKEFYYNVVLGKDSAKILKGDRMYFVKLWLDDVRCVLAQYIPLLKKEWF
jgi:hypothetical protein